MDPSYGIRATRDDSGYTRPQIVLKETNYRIWSIVVEQIMREKKLRQHAMGIVIRPFSPRVITLAVVAIAAAPEVDVVTGAAEITQEMVDHYVRKIEDLDAGIARANFVLLQPLEPKDVMATIMLPSSAEIWA